MASLYSVIPGLVPSAQEILEAELLAKQVLEGKFPDLDLREGTGLRDLVLRPTAYAFALLQKASDYYFVQNTLQGVNNATPEETVDDILSNWFLHRNTGTYAVISARLYFARQKNVTITTDISFSPNNSLQYFPETSSVYPSSAMTYDSYSNEWYLDISLRAASTGSVYNIGEGSLLYFTNFDPYFLRAEVNYLIDESTASETNSEFISRAESTISTRNLINIPSTDSRLRDTFSYLNRVTTVGAGDPDMIRDMVKVYFDQAPSFEISSVSINGDAITFSVNTNSFTRGQDVDLSGAVPGIFNGRYSILDVGAGTISISVPGNPGFISVVPKLKGSLNPLFIHNGGMADVYCGSRVSSSIVQLTTDANGIARIAGPVYSVVRSSVSGGDSEDTIPMYSRVATSYSVTADKTAGTLQLGVSNHGFLLTDRITLTNAVQYAHIYSLTCEGLTVTVTVGEEHTSGSGILFPAVSLWSNVQVGSMIRIDGVSQTAYNGSFVISAIGSNYIQYTVPSHIPQTVPGGVVGPVMYNMGLVDTASVSGISYSTIVVSLPNMWVGDTYTYVGSTGNAVVISAYVNMVVSNPYANTTGPYAMSVNSGTVTVYAYNHGVSLGRMVTIKNSPTNALNGSWRVLNTSTENEFQVYVDSLSSSPSIMTSGDVTYVDQRNDNGFSARQVLDADFGQPYANSTVSFELGMFSDVSGIQDYLESPSNRVLCGDYLARGFNLYMLDVSVTSYGGTAPSTALIQSTLGSYLSALPTGATLVVSEFVRVLGDVGITSIKTPVGVAYSRYTRDLTPVETNIVIDYLDPNDKTNIFLLRSIYSDAENV